MFSKSKYLLSSNSLKISKRLISNEFKKVLNAQFDPVPGIAANQLQLTVVNKSFNALNLDLFVNNIKESEDRRSVILELLARLRSSKWANDYLESTNFAVVRHLLSHSTLSEMVPIIQDRLQYGIFLDNFTGLAVTEAINREKEFALGLPLLLKMILLDELDSVFIQGVCAKSCLIVLNNELSSEPSTEIKKSEATPPSKGSNKNEKKIRVKFLRNPIEYNIHEDMTKALMKISLSANFPTDIKNNATILACILSKNFKLLHKTLDSANGELIFKDVFELSKEILSRANESQNEMDNFANKVNSKKTFEDALNTLLEDTLPKEEALLIEHQKKMLPEWQKQREQLKLAIDEDNLLKERKDNVEKIVAEMSNKEQLLWFFEKEDELDLEIYNKRVSYPKRWFGKKKTPRVVDEHYVPPEIRRIN